MPELDEAAPARIDPDPLEPQLLQNTTGESTGDRSWSFHANPGLRQRCFDKLSMTG
jgi:hypothetical protein